MTARISLLYTVKPADGRLPFDCGLLIAYLA